MVVAGIHAAFFRPQQIGLLEHTRALFHDINKFTVVSICTTLHVILVGLHRGTTRVNKNGRPVYESIDVAEMQRIFDKKMYEFSRQSPLRIEVLLEKLTKRVRTSMPPSPEAADATLETDIADWADTLVGLESEDENTARDGPKTAYSTGPLDVAQKAINTNRPTARGKAIE